MVSAQARDLGQLPSDQRWEGRRFVDWCHATEEVNREVAREALSGLGASVDAVENGLEAVEAVQNRAYDIVFMDGSMPELDGFMATRRIREWEARSGGKRTPGDGERSPSGGAF